MYHESEKPHALVCTEVWGGNRKVIRTVKPPSLVAWVASVPLNEGEGGGDLHYMSVCDYDLISRVALADVSGHGSEVEGESRAGWRSATRGICLRSGITLPKEPGAGLRRERKPKRPRVYLLG